MSELAAYLNDMFEDGESSRMGSNAPGWILPPPVPQGESSSRDGTSSSGSGNRVTFKRHHGSDFEAYDDYEGGGGGAADGENNGNTSNGPAVGWAESHKNGNVSGHDAEEGARRPKPTKRAKGTPSTLPREAYAGNGLGGAAGDGESRRGSAKGPSGGRRAAGPSVVQALTCLASGLPSDSEDNKDGLGADGGRGGGHAAAPSVASALASKEESQGDGRKASDGHIAVKTEEVPGTSTVAVPAKQQQPVRRESRVIDDVLANLSIDRALEQLTPGGEVKNGGDQAVATPTGQAKVMRQRASVYVLMHAIAAVNTANGEDWEEGQEPLDSVEPPVPSTI